MLDRDILRTNSEYCITRQDSTGEVTAFITADLERRELKIKDDKKYRKYSLDVEKFDLRLIQDLCRDVADVADSNDLVESNILGDVLSLMLFSHRVKKELFAPSVRARMERDKKSE